MRVEIVGIQWYNVSLVSSIEICYKLKITYLILAHLKYCTSKQEFEFLRLYCFLQNCSSFLFSYSQHSVLALHFFEQEKRIIFGSIHSLNVTSMFIFQISHWVRNAIDYEQSAIMQTSGLLQMIILLSWTLFQL